MVRIAPVRLAFNPKTLWFDSNGLELASGDAVVVDTARGKEFGKVSDSLFEMAHEDTKKLKSPLKPVLRKATEEDVAKNEEAQQLSLEALPIFKQMAAEVIPDMNPVAVEYLFDGDKAVFYFESEERVDFRELVRKLASQFHVRIDMKQIGVRDGARMVGGLGHCGQELCCRRLGGEFNPVSIRMAKEQDLSLNPQKISGVCGRLMCCLRYEFDAYKDFHSRAPKKNAKISTPDGEGKVVDLDVPREVVSIKVGDEKPVKVPLCDMEPPSEGTRPSAVGAEAWQRATEPPEFSEGLALNLFSAQLTAEDKLAEPGKVRHVHGDEEKKPTRSRRRRSGSQGKSSGTPDAADEQSAQRKQRRRRSTTVKSDGTAQTEKRAAAHSSNEQKQQKAADGQQKQSSRRRRSRSQSKTRQAQGTSGAQGQAADAKSKPSQVGRNSSGLRAARSERGSRQADGAAQSGEGQSKQAPRRRRRSHKTNSQSQAGSE